MPDQTSQPLPINEDTKQNTTATAVTTAQTEEFDTAISDISSQQLGWLQIEISSDAALAGALENSSNPDVIAILGTAQVSLL
jgi:hypothetical protein